MYKIAQLPYDQFELLGMSKKDVLKLPARTMNALLSGQKSDLMRFQNTIDNKEVAFEGKIKLTEKPDGTLSLTMIPVSRVPENKYQLTKEQIDLLSGDKVNFVEKELKLKDGSAVDVLITKDKDLNQFVAIEKDAIKPPISINNTNLSSDQINDFAKGKAIEINKDKFVLNPTNELGISEEFGDTRKVKQMTAHNKYSYDERQLAVDIALAASGLGTALMIGHLIRLANTTNAAHRQNADNPLYWDGLKNVQKEVSDLANTKQAAPTQEDLNNAVQKHLKDFNLGIYEGKVLDFGKVESQDKSKVKEVSYLKLELKNGQEQTISGSGIQSFLNTNKINKGDLVKAAFQGKDDGLDVWSISKVVERTIEHKVKNILDDTLKPKKQIQKKRSLGI